MYLFDLSFAPARNEQLERTSVGPEPVAYRFEKIAAPRNRDLHGNGSVMRFVFHDLEKSFKKRLL